MSKTFTVNKSLVDEMQKNDMKQLQSV